MYAVYLDCKGVGTICQETRFSPIHLREVFTSEASAEAGLTSWRRRYPMSDYFIAPYEANA